MASTPNAGAMQECCKLCNELSELIELIEIGTVPAGPLTIALTGPNLTSLRQSFRAKRTIVRGLLTAALSES